jgi:hypothetical protein
MGYLITTSRIKSRLLQLHTLKDFAEEFTKAGFPLEAILMYRCLTEDILARARS